MEQSTVRKTFKYQLTPTPAQERALENALHQCHRLYNVALEQRRTWWSRGQGISATYYQQKAELPDLRAACPEYAEINAQVVQDVILRVERAFQAFFRRLRAGESPGYPRFQMSTRYHSFTYPQYGRGAVLDGKQLNLSRIGSVAIRLHRPLDGIPKTVTISREADGWYACISCTDVQVQPLPPTGCETGIDVGLRVFLITAEGKVVENPGHYHHAERALAKAQRRVARRKKGSSSSSKAVRLLAKRHQQVRRQRRDFHHKTALWLVRHYDVIYLEDLRVANLVRNSHLAKSISDAGWVAFHSILDSKAAYAGRRVIAVPPNFTSQDCSRCGARVAKSLSVRTHVCASCGLVLDRDENAARNIQRAGQALRGVAAIAAASNREAYP